MSFFLEFFGYFTDYFFSSTQLKLIKLLYSLIIATALHHAPLALAIFTGKTAASNP